MRILCTALTGLALLGVPAKADVSTDEANRLKAAATTVHDLRASPDKGIPEDLFKRAECVAVMPGVKKGAFIVGGEFGKGVVSCRIGHAWSAPVFLELEKGSAGLQIGGSSTDIVLLMMKHSALDKLLSDKVNLGADASVAAGPVGNGAAANPADILAYSRSKGAFAGVDISGGSIRADKDSNKDAYGDAYGTLVTTQDVLTTQKVAPPPAASPFLKELAPKAK